tara:strand:- start:979 stop:1602 length:624 start_codon:yes stop_codon:yes gene_type:complete
MKKLISTNVKVSMLSIALKFIYGSNNVIIKGKENYIKMIEQNKSIIFSVWHGHLLSIVYDLRNLKINALAGTHKDADLISQIATKWGWHMIRGSSKKNGARAYKKMLQILNQSTNTMLFITPDGPSGPARIPKNGIIGLAQSCNVGIVPIKVHYTKSWGFKNWDTFYIAKPFGNIAIDYGKPIYFKKSQNIEKCKSILIKAMEEKIT